MAKSRFVTGAEALAEVSVASTVTQTASTCERTVATLAKRFGTAIAKSAFKSRGSLAG